MGNEFEKLENGQWKFECPCGKIVIIDIQPKNYKHKQTVKYSRHDTWTSRQTGYTDITLYCSDECFQKYANGEPLIYM